MVGVSITPNLVPRPSGTAGRPKAGEPAILMPPKRRKVIKRRKNYVPGYRYLGAGTKAPYNDFPRNYLDEISRLHDIEYMKEERKGKNPYLEYNLADAKMFDKLMEMPKWERRKYSTMWDTAVKFLKVKRKAVKWSQAAGDHIKVYNHYKKDRDLDKFYRFAKREREFYYKGQRGKAEYYGPDTVFGRKRTYQSRYGDAPLQSKRLKPSDYLAQPMSLRSNAVPAGTKKMAYGRRGRRAYTKKLRGSIRKYRRKRKPLRKRMRSKRPKPGTYKAVCRILRRYNAKPLAKPNKEITLDSGVMAALSVNSSVIGRFYLMDQVVLKEYLRSYVIDPVSGAVITMDPEADATDALGHYGNIIRQKQIIHLRNNGTAPANIEWWYVSPRQDTDVEPTNDWNNGLDFAELNEGFTNDRTLIPFGYKPNDSPVFRKGWKITGKRYMKINPGEEKRISFGTPWSIQNIEYLSHHTLSYKRNCSRFLMYRITGCIAHDDTTTTNVGYSMCQVDYVAKTITQFQICGSTVTRQLNITSNLDTMAAGATFINPDAPDIIDVEEN